MEARFFAIPEYHDYLSPALARHLLAQSREVSGVPGLREVGKGGGLETKEALRFLVDLYSELRPELGRLLALRRADRKFIDERARACSELNSELSREITDPDYLTVLGLEDGKGRIVFGPKSSDYARAGGKRVAALPDYLQGPHVTLFGPPDSAKMAVNAMNAYHRKLPNEPEIVGQLLEGWEISPMWGADDEDSKTPLRADLVDAGVNLTACFEGNVDFQEGEKRYALAKDHLSLPIKRFPGLALPSSFLFFEESPIPLHLYDFALHLFRNWKNPRALVFYVPKLETEEEAAYIHRMIVAAERRVKELHPEYNLGTVRLMIVLENPRAILRAHEIMDALDPYFAGASLGWHDYLASTARLFKEDSHYRIPVKADPNIVIKYIKASHDLLAQAVGSRGGIQVGGMYGILPIAGNAASLQITLRGFVKDVITQLRRGLNGFWVAHPDFVRLGLALVRAWELRNQGEKNPLRELVHALLEPEYRQDLVTFLDGKDVEGMDVSDPNYVRKLIVADIRESDFIPNHHPDEVRYNVFQSLQYLTDWLSGNGCVALPTVIDGIPVRVMDDLATAERSRWEVWAELRHGRVKLEDFIRIAHEEMNFIRRDLSNEKKIVQVKWDARTAKWYPIALEIMLKLMTDRNPPEFATELLMPFTVESVRDSADPLAELRRVDPNQLALSREVARYHRYFEVCGVDRFAAQMAALSVEDLTLAEKIVRSFSIEEVKQAASFHGDIGQSQQTLDARASGEQALVFQEEESVRAELRSLGQSYLSKFGFKFLISAKGKTGKELLVALKRRITRSAEEELNEARSALWEISKKRLLTESKSLIESWDELRKKYGVVGAQLALSENGNIQTLCLGEAARGKAPVTERTRFEIASLSKTIASSFALEYFREKKIPLSSAVNDVLARTKSTFRIQSPQRPEWAGKVTLAQLMNHTALNLHYVKGFPEGKLPPVSELLAGGHGYDAVEVLNEPGTKFHYSGGGFLVLEHLIESLEGGPIEGLIRDYLAKQGIVDLTFEKDARACAIGYFDSGEEVPGGRLIFPGFAAGAFGTARDMATYLGHLSDAFHSLEGAPGISHDTAVQMLHGSDRGCFAFMGAFMGLGVFVAEAGANRIALHQGANEGFRAIYAHCFAGPDQGKGFVVFANGDNRSVLFVAELAQQIFCTLGVSGIDYAKFAHDFDFTKLPQEQVVNLGYKKLVFDAFIPDLPEAIVVEGPFDPLSAKNILTGAEILSVTNQRFARASQLLSTHHPIFDPELFGRQGKIMDSWETVRHNPLGSDVLVVRLKSPSEVRYLRISTEYHDGNHFEFVRLEGRTNSGWVEFLPKTKLHGHSRLCIDLGRPTEKFTEIRIEAYPDGGLSRLGLYASLPAEEAKNYQPLGRAKSERFPSAIPKSHKPLSIPYRASAEDTKKNRARCHALGRAIDLASLAYGGAVLQASNEHYGPAAQVVSPYRPLHMFDGLENARSRQPGHSEDVTLALAEPSVVARIVLDFAYFVNNNPREIAIDARTSDGKWAEIVAVTSVKAFAGNRKEFRIESTQVFDQIRVRTVPDGGINRVRVYGPVELSSVK